MSVALTRQSMEFVRLFDKQGLTSPYRSSWLPLFQQSGSSGEPVLAAQHPTAIMLTVQCIYSDKPVLNGTGQAVNCTMITS